MAINGPNKTAGGGFTLPQHAFIPHPNTQAFGNGSHPGEVLHPGVNSGLVQPAQKVVAAPNVHGGAASLRAVAVGRQLWGAGGAR